MNQDEIDALSPQEIHELRRVLATFKRDLPQHDLVDWFITRQYVTDIIEKPPNYHVLGYDDASRILIRGHGTCLRCHRQFDIPNYGNFTTWESRIQETIEEAKEWVRRDALRAGPCWGDVPLAPSHPRGYAVEDAG